MRSKLSIQVYKFHNDNMI
uniref:Uncharacterized protein n=1 Tax=Anguilla anguilla TaxID=7936 RepID=A0A0E9S8W5_ANGAN